MPATPFIDIHTHSSSQNNQGCIEIINQYPNEENMVGMGGKMLYSIGIHPWYIQQDKLEIQFEKLDELLAHKNVVALGETGLDRVTGAPLKLQKEVFERHLIKASRHQKPVIVHAVKTYPETIEIHKKLGLNLRLIFHGFRGNSIIAKQLIKHGFYLSFGKHILDVNNKEADIFREIPLEKTFLETDDSEIDIKDIYMRAALIKGIPINQLKETLYHNFMTCFGNI